MRLRICFTTYSTQEEVPSTRWDSLHFDTGDKTSSGEKKLDKRYLKKDVYLRLLDMDVGHYGDTSSFNVETRDNKFYIGYKIN